MSHEISPADHARAVLNVLEDFAGDKTLLEDTQRAILNILEDFGGEKDRLESTQRAVLNILEDFREEKVRLTDMQRAVINILEDLAIERDRLEATKAEVVRSEQTVRSSLREKEVLLKEIHHRVKNNLQVISSLLSLQARYLVDPAARDIFSESQNRVQSIALVHEKLYQSAALSHVDFGVYVTTLIENLFHTFDAAERGIELETDLGGARLTIDLAIPCGLVVNELLTNALKHAFPDGRGGTITVRMSQTDTETELAVAADGVGVPDAMDPRYTGSVGLVVLYTFAEQIEAEVEVVRRPGTTFRLRFPRGREQLS
jgi:two-component sensor histidine kinase